MQRTVPAMLAAVSRELAALADLTAALQTELSPQAEAVFDIEAFQSLDLLAQTLACLAPFVAEIGAAVPRTSSVDVEGALDDICLSALADRLRGRAAPARENEEFCELF